MNIRQIKKINAVIIMLAVLTLLGISGSLNPVSAAGVTINGGVIPVTNYRQVTLAFTPPSGALQVSFKNEIDTAWSEWVDVSTRQWTLSPEPGIKTVSVQFRNSLTSTTVMPGKYSGTINLDYSLDTSFHNISTDTYGYQNLTVRDSNLIAANAVAIDGSGRKIVVGTIDRGNGNTDLAVVRYLADGSNLDPDFNGNGKFTYGGPGEDTGKALVLDSLGNIIVVGSISQDGLGNTDILMLRIKPDGSLDDTFGNGGVVVYTGFTAGADSANAVAIDLANQKIVVAGTFANGATNADAIVLRFDSVTGELDSTFGSLEDPDNVLDTTRTGAVIFGGPGNDTANGVAIDLDSQKIVVAGTYEQLIAGDTSAWIFKLDANGELDTQFGAGGDIAFGDSGADTANAVAINGGKIVVVGTYDWLDGDTDIWVQQLLLNDGTPDASFNGTGSNSFGGLGADSGNAVAIQGTKIVVAGTYVNESGKSFVWATRLNSDGSEDITFNNGSDYTFGAEDIVGSDLTYGTANSIAGRAVALQEDGGIILAGIGNQIGFSTTMLTLRIHGVSYPLTVVANGSGTVAAFPGTLTNGTGNYVPETLVTLTAKANGGSFTGWSGDAASCGTALTCNVTMNQARSVTANFSSYLTLDVTVFGAGFVTSPVLEGGISCAAGSAGTCSNKNLPPNSSVTLTATSGNWYTTFTSWSGDAASCGTAATCTVTMDSSKYVTAVFTTNNTVRLSSTKGIIGTYPTLEEAYMHIRTPDLLTSATITAQAIDYPENPSNLSLPVALTFDGGKGPDFVSIAGYTTVLGPMRISNGSVRVKYFKIK